MWPPTVNSIDPSTAGSTTLGGEPPVIAIVGAGPAGLLFGILASIRSPAARVTLFDKRSEYARTHRLRMAPEA